METTLNKIKAFAPCSGGWSKLLKGLGKAKANDSELELMDILKHNGIKDAVWALRCFDYKDYGLFLADIAESVLHIYTAKHPYDERPASAIKAVRDYCKGLIDKNELNAAADAYDAAYAAAADAAAARSKKWGEIKVLFVKHFGEK